MSTDTRDAGGEERRVVDLAELEEILVEIVGEAVTSVADRNRWRRAVRRAIAARQPGAPPLGLDPLRKVPG